MTYINKEELIKFLEQRVNAFQDRVERDFGSGLSDDLGRYRESKLLKKFVEDGIFDIEK